MQRLGEFVIMLEFQKLYYLLNVIKFGVFDKSEGLLSTILVLRTPFC